MLSLRSILFAVLLTLNLSSIVRAQDPPSDDEVLKVSTDLLLFPIRVRDRSGHAVPGLTEHDLSLKDDDRATKGLYFSPGADRVAMMFALDQSGSLREIISQQRDATLALFARFSERSTIAILRFTDTPKLVVPFGRDTGAIQAGFKFSAGNNQRTAIFDAAAAAVKAFSELPLVRAERRIVILISDGLDNSSKTKASTVIDSAVAARVSFYVIHLPIFEPRDGQLAVRTPARGFRDLSEKTGGKYFLVGDSKSALATSRTNDLSPVFQAIEEDLRSQYLLGFYINESARDGRRHEFSVNFTPPGIEYSLAQRGYARSQKFFIQMPRGASKLPN